MASVKTLLRKEFGIGETEPPMSGTHAARLLKNLRMGMRKKIAETLVAQASGEEIKEEVVLERSHCLIGDEYFEARMVIHRNGRVTVTS